jgi:iron(III) transport system permease protein
MQATYTEPEAAPAARPPGRARAAHGAWIGRWGPAVLLLPLIVAPVLLLLYGTFRSEPPGLGGAWTLDNYRAIFTSDFAVLARNSLAVGAGSTVVAFVIALILALAIARFKIPGAKLLDSILVAPAYLPPFVGAIAWVFLLSPRIGFLNNLFHHIGLPSFQIYSMKGIIFVMGLYAAPIAYLYLRPAFLAMDASLEEAARVFGSTPWQAMRRVILPLVKPALLAALLILFITGIGEFGIPGILGTQANVNVVATQVLVDTTSGTPPEPGQAAVLGLVLGIVTIILLTLSTRLLRNQSFITVGGRGGGDGIARTGVARWASFAFCLLYILVALILPLGVLVIGSLQPYVSPDLSAGWTTNNYAHMWNYPNAATSITNSIELAVLAAVITVALSLSLGYLVVRRGGRLGQIVDQIASLPLALPHVVFGLSLIWVWVGIPVAIYGTKWILLLAFVAMFLPFVMRVVVSSLRQIDGSLEEAGRMSGATAFRVTRKIMLPLLAPAMMSGATIVMYHSMREISASLLLYTPGNEVMPIAIWDLFGNGVYGELFALCVVNIAVILVMVAAGNLLSRRYRRL